MPLVALKIFVLNGYCASESQTVFVFPNVTDISTNQCASIFVSFDEGNFMALVTVLYCIKYYQKRWKQAPLFFFLFQSAIGEGMTRRDHSDVSNQVNINY